jgi:hypothetical protein
MRTRCGRLTFSVSIGAICALTLLSQGAAFAQEKDPLIGTWNLAGANADGTSPFIAVMTFNLGGTTVEYDTGGTNASASPGESISLGKWSKTDDLAYQFKEQNYIYDSSGNLSLIAITGCKVTLASTLKRVGGTCEIKFYQCSVSQCPGTLVVGPVALTLNGRRF